MTAQELTKVRVAVGDYPQTAAFKKNEISSSCVLLDQVDINPVYKAFAEMIRNRAYDISEMAIITYLQAKSWGKPVVLLPCVLMGRFQHNCLLYNSEKGTLTPKDLEGRRVGVRSYTQTTGAWLRGHLQSDYGCDISKVHWVNFEDAHVLEYRDPPFVERASFDKNLLQMVLEGELDAGIFGAELPTDPRLKSIIPNPDQAVKEWHAKHKVVPLNHMVVASTEISKSNPTAVAEVFRMLHDAKRAAGLPKPGGFDFHPFGVEACRPALKMIISYAVQQKLIPKSFEVDELFDDNTRKLVG
jgi:4,5-dihydroxyphthalate decarboxylase